ncbi:MAG: MFS transporter, partial [Pseudomonadales bacterium]|nr:MFS transporter [Pseudomonadales bacterium]
MAAPSLDAAAAAGVPDRRRAFAILFGCLIAVGMGQTIVFAVLPPLGREIGLVEMQVGAIVSASSITFFIASPIWGRTSDRWGRKRVLLTGLVGYTIGTLIFATGFWAAMTGLIAPLTAFFLLTVLRMGQSTVMSATPPAASAYVADVTDVAGRTKGMGGIGASNNVGAILGPAIGGLLAGISLLAPLYFAALATLVAAIVVAAVLPEPKRQALAQRRGRLRYTDPRILPFVVVGVLMFMGFAVVQQTLAFRFQDVLGLTGQQTARLFGFAMMFSALMSLVSQGVIVQRMDLAPGTLLRIALPLLIAAFLVMTLADTRTPLFLAMGVLGLGMGLAGPGFMAGASLAVGPEEQGAVAGVASSCGPLGFTIGPLLGTGLYQIDPHLPYLVTAVVYLPLLAFVWRARWTRHEEPEA